MMSRCPDELRRAYHQGRLVIFVGAGVSMSVRWDVGGVMHRGPSWSELVNEAAKQMGFLAPELLRARGNDLQILEYYKIKKDNVMELSNWLVRTMSPPDPELKASPIHQELANSINCKLIYTTNYDDFIERSFRLHGRPHRVIATEGDMGATTDDCEIVKFHGDLNHPEKMVLSESDYHKRLALSTDMDYRFRADLLGRVCLFIGYSFGDWNVSYLFRMINEQFGALKKTAYGRRAYIMVADPSEFERELFGERNIDVIAIGGANMTNDVVATLREMRTK